MKPLSGLSLRALFSITRKLGLGLNNPHTLCHKSSLTANWPVYNASSNHLTESPLWLFMIL